MVVGTCGRTRLVRDGWTVLRLPLHRLSGICVGYKDKERLTKGPRNQ